MEGHRIRISSLEYSPWSCREYRRRKNIDNIPDTVKDYIVSTIYDCYVRKNMLYMKSKVIGRSWHTHTHTDMDENLRSDAGSYEPWSDKDEGDVGPNKKQTYRNNMESINGFITCILKICNFVMTHWCTSCFTLLLLWL